VPNGIRPPEILYRALTRRLADDGSAGDGNFRLRRSGPNPEDTLSVASTPAKAMGSLTCKGYVSITSAAIRSLGLDVSFKERDNPENDPELWEITGIPLDDEQAQVDLAIALAKLASKPVRQRRDDSG
jgi:hypothetical protein